MNFSCFTEPKAHEKLLRKVFYRRVRPPHHELMATAGTEARPT
jgi:hypothetical protein